jgi:2-polyprenyl-3-methyl-5-hydroxy-6-metoxy-1,4-benzoquinol methylase
MKYGAIPESLLESLALAAGKVPLPLLDAIYSLMRARGLMAGVRLGIFEALRDGPRTAAEVAAARGLDPECTGLLLRMLAFSDYVSQKGSRFALSKLGRRSLVKGAPMEMCGYLEWNYTQWDFVAHLEDLVRTGRGLEFHQTMTAPSQWASYQRGMLEVARFVAPILASRVPVRRGARRLLDLAGSHGLLGAAICRKHPPMRSVVLDLPQALDAARALAKEEGIADLVEHRAGDLSAPSSLEGGTDFGADNDVVLLANILHHFQPDANAAILHRAHAALAPNGTAAIWEIERPESSSPVGAGDGAALFFRLTSTASCYSGAEYAAWLAAAGFTRVRIHRPALSPGGVLVTGRKELA